ncbi:MAG: hypothetical protein FWH28_04510 [Clostridiales bacterium]|nr:hypothetical protein [Clostridiales bacterium]
MKRSTEQGKRILRVLSLFAALCLIIAGVPAQARAAASGATSDTTGGMIGGTTGDTTGGSAADVTVAAGMIGGPGLPEGGRNIYVGDILKLDIRAEGVSADSIRERFAAFEIVELTENRGWYQLSFRCFEPGAYAVQIGDKEVLIQVASTLDDIVREDLFEGGAEAAGSGFPFYWRYLFAIVTAAFILSLSLLLLNNIRRKKARSLSPYDLFLQRAGNPRAEAENYLVYLTFYFKAYLEALFRFRIIGKTSAEILKELKAIAALDALLPDIGSWLTECDRLKFTGPEPSSEEKQGHYVKLLDLVIKVEAAQSEAPEDETPKAGAA